MDANISNDTELLKEADALVLPGVGAFGAAMNHISTYKDIIYNHIDEGKAFLGICLGLQLLFTESDESPNTKGLDIFKGRVKRFNLPDTYKIPHMGWNQISVKESDINNTSILQEADNEYMYFVHSYYIEPENKDIVTAYTNYHEDIPVAIGKDNVFALQFHPEKSGKAGLEILKRFVEEI